MKRRIKFLHSIPYGKASRNTLDVYWPVAAFAAPVIVFFYGGAWSSGNKKLYRYVGKALARRGYVAVIPDYRIYPEVRYPGFLEDAALAVRWAADNARQFGGHPRKMFLNGHSAGAHIAAMLTIDSRWLENVGLAPGRDLAGLIGISGPYDFLPLRDDKLKAIFGGANRAETQPIFHVSADAPPALLITGSRDRIVEPNNSARLAARLRAVGNDATVLSYGLVGHFLVIAALAPLLRFVAPVLRDMDAFIAEILESRRDQNEGFDPRPQGMEQVRYYTPSRSH